MLDRYSPGEALGHRQSKPQMSGGAKTQHFQGVLGAGVPIQAPERTFLTFHPSVFPLSSIALPGLIFLYLWEGRGVLDEETGKTATIRDTSAQKHTSRTT